MIALVTPTRDRRDAFRLCSRWITSQNFCGSMTWVIVDDGTSPVVPPTRPRGHWGDWCVYLRREPSTEKCSLQSNLLHAIPTLEALKPTGVVMIEDDEYYGQQYVARMVELLKEYSIVGERGPRYYNVATRQYGEPPCSNYASLCRTAFRAELLPTLANACHASRAEGDVAVDHRMWGTFPGWKRPSSYALVGQPHHSVAIKGMPGLAGAGRMHQPDKLPHTDPQLRKLNEWIGEDSGYYANFYGGA